MTALAFGCLLLGATTWSVSMVMAQTSNFANTARTVTLPKGSKIDPRYLLRRKAPAKDPDAKKPLTAEEQAAEDAKKLADNLDGQLLGAWTRVSSVTENLSAPAIQAAAKRCFQQLTLKPLKFQTGAAEQLPDIDALFGDIVYYRTEKGLQRLDITNGLIRLVSEIAVNQLKNSQLVWRLTGERLRLRIRFSKPLPQAPKARFMIEETGFYLRCPLNKKDLFNVDP
ncbi:MAG: hypothetical protein ABJH63_04865 [Rhizobiaceae bacterium]